MIEAIRYLGERSLAEKQSVVEGLTLPVQAERNQKQQHIVIVDFDLNKREILINFEQVKRSTAKEYLWIGSADGAASPQWYGTVSNAEYFLSQTIPNLLERWNKNDSFYSLLQETRTTFFLDLGATKKNEERYRYVVDPKFFGGELRAQNKQAKEEVTKCFHEHIKHQLRLSSDEIALYSLAINSRLIVNEPEYKRIVIAEKESVYKTGVEGICSVTGEQGLVTGETTKLKFNYYINDKINFASNLEKKNYIKNMSIGKRAYHQLLAGETYIMNELNTRFGGLSCYVIPDFMYKPLSEQLPIDEWSRSIQNLVKTVRTVETMDALNREMRRDIRRQDRQNQVMLNFLFYIKAQSSFKIAKLLQDIPMRHINELGNLMVFVEKVGERHFGEGHWKIGLGQVYYMIPMKEQRGENYEKKKILAVYEAMLARKQISYDWLIMQFIHLAKIYHFEQFKMYQIKQQNADFGMVKAILQSQLLLYLLNELGVVRRGKQVPVQEASFQLQDEEMKRYLQEMNYGNAEGAMFLLGMLIANVASKQRQKLGNKAILNKINFQGMNKTKVQSLSIDVFEKLTQYKILTFNESLFAEHKRLFDLALTNWKLSDREVVFYLLSGYAYGTNRLFKKNDETKLEKELQEQM